MGRDLSYLVLYSKEEHEAYLLREKVMKGLVDYDSLTEQEKTSIRSRSWDFEEVLLGRNAVRCMHDEFFTIEELHKLIEESLAEKNYKEVSFLASLALSDYGVIIDSS